MGRFAKVWPDELRQAIEEAVLDRGLTVRAACKLALSGQLEGGEVPAIDGATEAEVERRLLANAYTWTSSAKRERAGQDVPDWVSASPDKAIDTTAAKVVAIAAGEVRRLERQKAGKRDLDRLRKATQVLREARALVRGDAPTRTGKARDASTGKDPGGGSTAEDGAMGLLAAHRRSATGENPRQDDTGQSNGDGEHGDARGAAATTENTEAETEGAEAEGILMRAEDGRDDPRGRAAAELGIEVPSPGVERD